jgi:curli production assembly/transport component CsgE
MRSIRRQTRTVGTVRRGSVWKHRGAGLAILSLHWAFCTGAACESITPASPSQTGSQLNSAQAPVKRDVTGNAPLSATPSVSADINAGAKPAVHLPAIHDSRSLEDAIHGVVTNQVITLAGQDFYNAFVATWRDAPLAERYNISVYERPSARWGSLVWVEFEHRRLFEAFLAPARTNIRPVAERAAMLAYQKLVQTDLERLLFRDQDLGRDEL